MSDSQHDFETLARAFTMRELSREARSTCPDSGELMEAVAGTLEREQRLRIVDHVSQCAECTQAWRLAMEIGARPAGASEQPGRSLSMHSSVAELALAKSVAMRRAALAMGLVCVAGVAAYLAIPVKDQPPQYRGVVHPDAPVSRVPQSLPRNRFLLQWSPGPQGSTYEIRLSTPELVPLLVRQDLTSPEFLVPGAVLGKVAPGEQLLWQVEVRLPDGERIASQTYVVTLN